MSEINDAILYVLDEFRKDCELYVDSKKKGETLFGHCQFERILSSYETLKKSGNKYGFSMLPLDVLVG